MIRTKPLFFLTVIFAAGCDRPSAPSPSKPLVEPAPTPSATIAVPAPDTKSLDASLTLVKATATNPAVTTFDAEPLGGPSTSFEGVVGDWHIGQASGATGLMVDGSHWRDGTPSANLADQAKRLYGDRYAEFLDGVKTFAFYPLAIRKDLPPEGDIRISIRFYPIAGKIDQGAGIAFGIAPDGSYYGVRSNALEDNLLFFRVVKGKRTVFDTVRDVSTPTRTWHTLAMELRGKKLVVEADGKKRFEKTLDTTPTGRVGVWSKADSQVLFDDVEVTKL